MFIAIDKLPLNSNGKVDRDALPKPDLSVQNTVAQAKPDGPILAAIKELVEEIIETEVPSSDLSLLNLGATSLDLIRIVNSMEARFGTRPISLQFLQTPTLASLAASMSEAIRIPEGALIALQRDGSGTPLFCIHDVVGSLFPYQAFARRFAGDRPVWGIEYQGESAGFDVESMASNYVRKIRTVQPQGPIALVGFSFGATVAFEMARQLRAEGIRVSLVALLDGGPLGYPHAPFGMRARSMMADVLAHPMNAWPGYIYHQLIPTIHRALRLNLRRLGILQYLTPDLPHLNRLHEGYVPGPYQDQGPIDLFRCLGESHQWRLKPDQGWGPFARGGIRIHDVPCSHLEMLTEPAVGEVAATIAGLLHKKEAGGSSKTDAWEPERDSVGSAYPGSITCP